MRVALLEADEAQTTAVANLLSKISLNGETIVCTTFIAGERLRNSLRQETYDLVLLDAQTENSNGADMLLWLRNFQKSDVPVIVISESLSERDIAQAFGNGADDYVGKPLRSLEFCARVARLLSRTNARVTPRLLNFGNWQFDRAKTSVRMRKGQVEHHITLTEREFRLALALFEHVGSALSRSHLLEYSGVSGQEGGSRALDSHVYRLRSKLFLESSHGISLRTVYGYGYRLEFLSTSVGLTGTDKTADH